MSINFEAMMPAVEAVLYGSLVRIDRLNVSSSGYPVLRAMSYTEPGLATVVVVVVVRDVSREPPGF